MSFNVAKFSMFRVFFEGTILYIWMKLLLVEIITDET